MKYDISDPYDFVMELVMHLDAMDAFDDLFMQHEGN